MNKKLIPYFFLLIGINGYAADEVSSGTNPTQYRGFNVALHKCDYFSGREGEENFIRAYKLWFGGYLTSINNLLGGKDDVINGGDLDDVMGWLSSYCASNSKAYISEAASDMIIYFDEQRITDKKNK